MLRSLFPATTKQPLSPKSYVTSAGSFPKGRFAFSTTLPQTKRPNEPERPVLELSRNRGRGKGFVVQRVFEIVDADICVLVDGDDTYFAEDLDTLLAPILAGEADMVVGNRLVNASAEALTGFRRFGNRFLIGLVNLLTRTTLHDVLCGYRAMNRRFRKAVQLQSSGFEIETELTLRAVREGMAIAGSSDRLPRASHGQLLEAEPGERRLAYTVGDHSAAHWTPRASPEVGTEQQRSHRLALIASFRRRRRSGCTFD